MKRVFAMLIIFALLLSVCGCAKTSADTSADVTLTFIYGGESIRVTLEGEEAKKVSGLLDGNEYDSVFFGAPSCGFDQSISFQVGNRVFAIARDTCNHIQDLGNLRYFAIPQDDMDYIHALFEKYGGYFPCV